MAATSLSLVQPPSSHFSSNLLHNNNNRNLNTNLRVSFRPNNNNNNLSSLSSVPLLLGGGGSIRGGGGRGGFSSGAGGGDGNYYRDDDRMGPWESFLEGLRIGFSTPYEKSALASFLDFFGLSNIIPTFVFWWVIEKHTGWVSTFFKVLENYKADSEASGTVTAT